jgi:hypothetical protein
MKLIGTKTMDTAQAVQELADIFADAEATARKVKNDFRSARKLLEVISTNEGSGALKAQAAASAMDLIATQFEAGIWKLHADLTEEAKARGIDLPSLRDGGGGR